MAKSAKSAATRVAKGAAKKTAKAAASKAASAGGDRIGRGTRWTEDQVSLLLTTVKGSATAKQAFETVAKELGKSAGTVQQKYYNLQKASSGGSGARRGRPRGSATRSTSAPAATRSSAATSELRTMTVDQLVSLAKNVKGEIDRRRQELDAASKLLAG